MTFPDGAMRIVLNFNTKEKEKEVIRAESDAEIWSFMLKLTHYSITKITLQI